MTAAPVLEVDAETPEIFDYLYDPPLGTMRYRGSYGGRGGGRSWQIARALLIHGMNQVLRILCAREFQNSIKDSVHKLLCDQIDAMGLGGFYRITETSIIGINGTEFLFKGLRRDVDGLKSTEGIDICWIEEAHRVSEHSWRTVIPTIRKKGSEIWFSFNPELETDPTYVRFVLNTPPRSIIRKVSFSDNPFLPEVLHEEEQQLLLTDPEAHAVVWGGDVWRRTDAEIFGGKCVVEDFESPVFIEAEQRWSLDGWQGPYYGLDFGFANDPAVCDRLWIAPGPKGPRLMVDYEEYGTKLNADDLAQKCREVPGAEEHTIFADCSRPETINELRLRGLRVVGAPKWDGSIKDGISHIRTYSQVVIHPRCKLSIGEIRMYRYKVDPLTEEVLPIIIDKHNHGWDAKRYALSRLIKRRRRPQILVGGGTAPAAESAHANGNGNGNGAEPAKTKRRVAIL